MRLQHPIWRTSTIALAFGIASIFRLEGGSTSSAYAQAQEPDRAAIVRAFFDAANRGDVDAELALFTPNGLFFPSSVVQGGSACGAPATGCGGVLMCNLFQQQAANGLIRTLTDLEVNGSIVTGHFVEANAARRAEGTRDLTAFMVEIPEDRISGFVVMLDLSDPETAVLGAAQAQAQPAAASPACQGAGE